MCLTLNSVEDFNVSHIVNLVKYLLCNYNLGVATHFKLCVEANTSLISQMTSIVKSVQNVKVWLRLFHCDVECSKKWCKCWKGSWRRESAVNHLVLTDEPRSTTQVLAHNHPQLPFQGLWYLFCSLQAHVFKIYYYYYWLGVVLCAYECRCLGRLEASDSLVLKLPDVGACPETDSLQAQCVT